MKAWLLALLLIALSVNVQASNAAQRSFLFEYDVTLRYIPSNASTINIWIPAPPETSYQKVEKIAEKSPEPSSVIYDKKYNNKISFYTISAPRDSSITISTLYHVKRYEYLNKPFSASKAADVYSKAAFAKYLLPSHLVTLSPRIRQLAAAITKGKISDIEKARAVYDYVFENLSYDKSIPGWGKGDTERACDIKAGNCTDFHSLFISLARASGIPARFLIGVPLSEAKKGQKKSYHCWAEFYAKDVGWVPVDISEAWKDRTKYDYYFGTIDENRVEFTQGRDIVLTKAQKKTPLNYFVFPYVEIDGKPFKNVEVTFNYEDDKKTGGEKREIGVLFHK